MDLVFYFKIDAAAEWAINDETGESCPAYTRVTFEDAKNPPEDMNEYHQRLCKSVAEEMLCNEQYVTAISQEEYDRGTAEIGG